MKCDVPIRNKRRKITMAKKTRAERNFKFETLQLHVGQEQPDPVTDARAVPIYQTSSYVFRNCEHAAARFGLTDAGNIYGRLTNPTEDVFEKRIAALEGGVAALAVASGAAAATYVFQNLAHAGDHIVAAKNIYGGTYNLLAHTLPEYGVTATFVDPFNYEEVENAIQENTKAIHVETLGNPNSDVVDIEKLASIAHAHKIPLVVDNTFATPYLVRPIEYGADIVFHSATKFIGGHGTTIGGVIIDSGNFDWEAHADKFPGLTTPDESYHGIIYTKKFGKAAYITKATAQVMRDLGSIPSPQNSFLLNIGLETLHLRVPRHCENAQKVAEYLQSREDVAWVNYPGLENDKYHALAQKYMPNGTCGVISFGLKGGRQAAGEFMDKLKLAAIVTHVADARTCVLHPASHTHRQLSDEQLREAGVDPSLIRLSVGIENVDDIIEDIRQALED